MSQEDTTKIRRLNDRFRQGDTSVPGEVFMTPGIQGLAEAGEDASVKDTISLISTIRNFNAFTKDNDPYCEHDFGSFKFKGETCFWKIDVYDHALKWAAPDPTNPKLSKRVLTVMLASEY